MGIQLPRWVWIGTACLSGIAGMVNAVGYLGFEHQAVSHLTGTTTLLGIAVAQGQALAVRELAMVAVAFLLGAVASGLIIQDSTLKLGRRYGVALGVEALLLAGSVPLFERQVIWGAVLAAAACGLQNAMVATYSGALVRTTHVTGLFTDLGVSIGHWLRGLPVGPRRFALCVLVIVSFAAGGTLGAWLFALLEYRALYVPAALTGSVGIGYAAYRQRRLAGGAA